MRITVDNDVIDKNVISFVQRKIKTYEDILKEKGLREHRPDTNHNEEPRLYSMELTICFESVLSTNISRIVFL